MDYTPTRQRPARELLEMNIALPYFAHDLDALIHNPNDNRGDNLDYQPRPKELVNFIRHMLINRTANNIGQGAGYHGGYDNLLHKIDKKGIDVAARQRLLKLQVLRLIATHYPTLAAECEYQSWIIDTPERSAA